MIAQEGTESVAGYPLGTVRCIKELEELLLTSEGCG